MTQKRSRNKVLWTVASAFLGALFAIVVILVPILGVRSGLKYFFLNWQEHVLIASSLMTGGLAGALVMRRKICLEENMFASSVKIECLDSQSEEYPFLVKGKYRLRVSKKSRTMLILLFAYLILYINLSVLCLYLRLGIVDIPALNYAIRTMGACLAMVGLYLILRALKSASTIPYFAESKYYDAKVGLLPVLDDDLEGNVSGQGNEFTVHGDKQGGSHIPKLSSSFLSGHPICLGWLIFMTGVPLVFQAWFPLIALPGIYVAFNWMFVKGSE